MNRVEKAIRDEAGRLAALRHEIASTKDFINATIKVCSGDRKELEELAAWAEGTKKKNDSN
jgi:hypothetical protein